MSLTTSYRAFEVLELLRIRCSLSARFVAESLLEVAESAYSRLRRSLAQEEGALSAEMDLKVLVAIETLVETIELGQLPQNAMTSDIKNEIYAELVERRKHVQLKRISTPCTQVPDFTLDELLAKAKQFTMTLI